MSFYIITLPANRLRIHGCDWFTNAFFFVSHFLCSDSPEPHKIDPNDPKGKEKAIHPAETFAEYQARKAMEDAEAAKK